MPSSCPGMQTTTQVITVATPATNPTTGDIFSNGKN